MTIIIKNKETLIMDEFKFQCSVGKNGLSRHKIEGDKKTPKGTFKIGNLYLRRERVAVPKTNLNYIYIKHEKMYRRDKKYDLLIPILYNTRKTKLGKGSAIFIHLTENYKSTNGCIALKKNDFLILLKIITKKTKIKII